MDQPAAGVERKGLLGHVGKGGKGGNQHKGAMRPVQSQLGCDAAAERAPEQDDAAARHVGVGRQPVVGRVTGGVAAGLGRRALAAAVTGIIDEQHRQAQAIAPVPHRLAARDSGCRPCRAGTAGPHPLDASRPACSTTHAARRRQALHKRTFSTGSPGGAACQSRRTVKG